MHYNSLSLTFLILKLSQVHQQKHLEAVPGALLIYSLADHFLSLCSIRIPNFPYFPFQTWNWPLLLDLSCEQLSWPQRLESQLFLPHTSPPASHPTTSIWAKSIQFLTQVFLELTLISTLLLFSLSQLSSCLLLHVPNLARPGGCFHSSDLQHPITP